METDPLIADDATMLHAASANAGRRPRNGAGFTLIEVVVVMTILAILAAVAIPAYTQYIVRGHRSEARGSLLAAAQWMERWRTERGSYLDGANLPPLPITVSPPTGTVRYNIGLTNTTGAAYTLNAIPVGSMAGDACGDLTLNNLGVRARTGTADMNLCWGR